MLHEVVVGIAIVFGLGLWGFIQLRRVSRDIGNCMQEDTDA